MSNWKVANVRSHLHRSSPLSRSSHWTSKVKRCIRSTEENEGKVGNVNHRYEPLFSESPFSFSTSPVVNKNTVHVLSFLHNRTEIKTKAKGGGKRPEGGGGDERK